MPPENRPARIFYGWWVVLAGFVVLASGAGIWTGFGVFFKPLLEEFGGSRRGMALVISSGMVIWALSQFAAGAMLNRFGPRKVIAIGVGIMGLGALLSSRVASVGGLLGTYGLIVGAGTGFATMNSVTVLVSRWFVKKRGTALGLTIAGFNAGQFLLIPLTQVLVVAVGWRGAFLIWAGVLWVVVFPLVAMLVRDDPERMGLHPDNAAEAETESAEPIATRVEWIPRGVVRKALGDRAFWLLFVSYVGCGFTDFTLYVHLPIFATGLDLDTQTAANTVGLIGGLSIIGVVGMGTLADRIGFRAPLALSYGIRCVGMILLTLTAGKTMLFVAITIYGVFHLATTPLTPGMAAALYGRRPLGSLYGYLLLGHSLGALLGPYVAGAVFDWTGQYKMAFILTAVILAGASACCAMIKARERD